MRRKELPQTVLRKVRAGRYTVHLKSDGTRIGEVWKVKAEVWTWDGAVSTVQGRESAVLAVSQRHVKRTARRKKGKKYQKCIEHLQVDPTVKHKIGCQECATRLRALNDRFQKALVG